MRENENVWRKSPLLFWFLSSILYSQQGIYILRREILTPFCFLYYLYLFWCVKECYYLALSSQDSLAWITAIASTLVSCFPSLVPTAHSQQSSQSGPVKASQITWLPRSDPYLHSPLPVGQFFPVALRVLFMHGGLPQPSLTPLYY